uniref:NADPH:adrenodoxin oxidoreductase, mitochondrial n=1 Tax=Rhipicephalus pulchellus TaxID=72859 RepID=L7M113_RHIPC
MVVFNVAVAKCHLLRSSRFSWCHVRRWKHSNAPLKVSIVGAGPAGFYTAQQVLKHPNAIVDIYEGLPVPFGLVRFGVAPDHPEVKNVIHTFTNIAKNPRCNLYGNVRLGTDITVADLRKAYHAVVLTYGADQERSLGVPGEDLPNVFSARKFVGWYNGHPADVGVRPDLSGETAVVIGHGNVALDVARILLSPPESLQETDIVEPALEALRKSCLRKVIVVGRRGPFEVAFTIKELREMTKIPGVDSVFRPEDFDGVREKLADLPRPRKRLLELMVQTSEKKPSNQPRSWELRFLRSPLRFLADANTGRVSGVELAVNRLEKTESGTKAVATGETETIPCQMVLKSIGYVSEAVDPTIPYDSKRGFLPNSHGRVDSLPGVYCSGWLKTGPIGVLVATMNSSFETGHAIVKDAESGLLPSDDREGSAAILELLKSKGVRPVTFDEWLKIEAHENAQGERKGKPSEKLLSIEEMLNVAFS